MRPLVSFGPLPFPGVPAMMADVVARSNGSLSALSSALGKMSSLIQLSASSQSGGEWTPSIVDVRNAGNPVTQTDTDRRSAVGASGNGLPTMVWDGSDVHVWPLDNAINNMATQLAFMWWYKPATVTGVQRQITIGVATGAASAEKLQIYATGATLRAEVYVNNTLGRTLTTGNVLTAAAWHNLYFGYNSALGGDANGVAAVNGSIVALTPGAIGAGDADDLTVLPQPTGNIILGGLNNQDAPTQPIANGGEWGPWLAAFHNVLTLPEIQALNRWYAPTV